MAIDSCSEVIANGASRSMAKEVTDIAECPDQTSDQTTALRQDIELLL